LEPRTGTEILTGTQDIINIFRIINFAHNYEFSKTCMIPYRVAQQVTVHVEDTSYCFCADQVNSWKR
jgi:hypothetical protein